jgi:hypothetical protein
MNSMSYVMIRELYLIIGMEFLDNDQNINIIVRLLKKKLDIFFFIIRSSNRIDDSKAMTTNSYRIANVQTEVKPLLSRLIKPLVHLLLKSSENQQIR